MIPLAIPQMTGREAGYLMDCVESNFVSSVGPYVDRFEAAVAAAAGTTMAVATSSGTTGLHAALVAVGVTRDDLVILPAFTFIASANAIAHCGASPWLFDISAESWTLDPVQLAQALDQKTERRDGVLIHRESGRRVAAIMPVFTLGMPADMDAISALAGRYDLPIVADAAAALGGLYKGRLSGTLGATLTVYSFNGNKTVTAGGGGAIAGSDPDLMALVKHLTTTARVGADYTHDRVGFNYRMTNLQAAVGCAQMESLDEFVAAKRRIAMRYNAELSTIPGLSPFPNPDWAASPYWFSGVTLNADFPGRVDELRTQLRGAGVDARPFWKPAHLQAAFLSAPREAMSITDGLWPRVLTLPCSTSLTESEQSVVIDAVRNLVGNVSAVAAS